jgi:hypothetical protein
VHPSPTRHVRPPRHHPARPSRPTTPGPSPVPTVQAQVPAPTQHVPPHRPATSSSRPSTAPSGSPATAGASRLAATPAHEAASTLPVTSHGGPSLVVFAVGLALVGALTGCSFAVARRRRAYPRWVPKHSRRAASRSWRWSSRR